MIGDFEVITGFNLNPAMLVISNSERFINHQLTAWLVKRLCAGFYQSIYKCLGRAIETWHFRLINDDFAIVDLQSVQSSHDVFNHLDADTIAANCCSSR